MKTSEEKRNFSKKIECSVTIEESVVIAAAVLSKAIACGAGSRKPFISARHVSDRSSPEAYRLSRRSANEGDSAQTLTDMSVCAVSGIPGL